MAAPSQLLRIYHWRGFPGDSWTGFRNLGLPPTDTRKESIMIRLFVRHPVSDFTAWRKAYDAFDEERKGMGVRAHGVFQTTDNPRDVTVWHDFETLDAAKAFAESSRLQEVMKQAGVAGEPTVWFTKEA